MFYHKIQKCCGIIKFTLLEVSIVMSLETTKKVVKRKAQVIKDDCVACGTCVNVCPIEAIKIIAGVFAEVDQSKCVGCSKCVKECPASVIEIITKEEVK